MEDQDKDLIEKQSMLPEIKQDDGVAAPQSVLDRLDAIEARLTPDDAVEAQEQRVSAEIGGIREALIDTNKRLSDMDEGGATPSTVKIPIEGVTEYVDPYAEEPDAIVSAVSSMYGNQSGNVGSYPVIPLSSLGNSNTDILEGVDADNGIHFKVNGWYFVAFDLPRMGSAGSGEEYSITIVPSIWKEEYSKYISVTSHINMISFGRHIHVVDAPKLLTIKMTIAANRLSFPYGYTLGAHLISVD